MNLVSEILNKVNASIYSFFFVGYNNLVATLRPELTLLLILFFVIYGYTLLRGTVEMPLRTAIRHVSLALFVYVLITGAGYGAHFFVQVFVAGPAKVASAIVNNQSVGNTANLNTAIGQAFDKGIAAGQRIMQNGGWTNWGPYVTGLLIMAIVIAFSGYALFLVILAKFALAVLIILAPLFLPLIFFSVTRGIFEGWLRQVVNFAIVPILVYAILGLIIHMIINYSYDAVAAGSIQGALPLVLSNAVGILLLLQVLGIAGGIAGGMSLATMGAVARAAGGGRRFAGRGSPTALRQRRQQRREQQMTKWRYKDMKRDRRQ